MTGKHTPGSLSVRVTEYEGQFGIVSNTSSADGDADWNDIYVDFCGYFGSYGPHVFAAAPDLLEALTNLLQVNDGIPMLGTEASRRIDAARAAIAKAKGGAA